MATQINTSNYMPTGPADQLSATVGAIAKGIVSGSKYPPLIFMARDIAARAPGERKDYLCQLRALFDEFLRRWRYTRDPIALEAVCTTGNAIHDLTWGAATGQGAGDCDEATAALGAAAAAIGIMPRIVIMAAPGRRNASHVYPEFFIPGKGWIPADPVAFPKTQFGQQPRAAWRRRFDLRGAPIGGTEPGDTMQLSDNEVTSINQWAGFDLAAYGLAGTDADEPETMGSLGGDEGNPAQPFGAFAGLFGVDEGPAIYAEADIITADGLALTPVMELGLADYMSYQSTGSVRPGALARDQFGNVYQFEPSANGIGGFFSSIFKGAKKLVKGALSVARMAIKKLPGGKYLLKLHDRLHKITMKLVRPLSKFVGPIAAKLAPIAALIPGYGPAISAALYTTGKIANLINKFDIRKDKKGNLKFKSGNQAKAFQATLKAEAARARVSLKKKPLKPGHMPAGSAAAATKLKSMGLRMTNPPPPLPPAILALLKSKNIPIPAQY